MGGTMATSKASGSRAPTTPGTYFLSLTVENLRCFGPPQTLDLSDGHGRHAPWTVILGDNGLGKTTLLECLATIARDTPRDRLARGSGNAGGARVEARTARFDGSASPREAVMSMSSRRFDRSSDAPVQDLLTFHYGASRRLPMGGGSAQLDDPAGIFLDEDAALRDPETWLLKADYNARLQGPEAERFRVFAERVREALVYILPEVAGIRIQPAAAPGGSPRVEARIADDWIPLRRLGFGYQSQIAWLVDLASRMFEHYPDSPDPLAEPAVVLVDEIDLHMHPRWQRQMIGYLTQRFPNTQFVVTAHSPLVVQAAAGANIVLLRRQRDHVVIDNDPEVLDNWRVDQILTSELFGLPSARPPQIEAQIQERRGLLAKARLTGRDRTRIAELEAEIGDLPAGETAEDRRAMDLIRRAAEKLQGRT
jgi:energy-coupling factor transporter ATP-binding protein EcfA2